MINEQTPDQSADDAGTGVTADVKTPTLFDLTEILVTLTYTMTDPPTVLKFHCALILAEAEIEARQKFFSLPEADQKAGRYKYSVDFMAKVATAHPEGLPGYASFAAERQDPGERIRAYFATETPMKARVLHDAIQRYTQMSQPLEFFR